MALGFDVEDLAILREQTVDVPRESVLAAEINAIKEQTRAAVISGAIEIGKRLCQAKEIVPVGSWGQWLKSNVDYSERTAQNLMRCFEEYGKKGIPEGMERASYTNALQLLGLPEDIRGALIENGSVEDMSTRELKAEIERLKQENEQRQLKISDLMGESAQLVEERTAARSAAAKAQEDIAAQEKALSDALEAAMLAQRRAVEAEERAGAYEAEKRGLEDDLRVANERIAEPTIIEKVVERVPNDVLAEITLLRDQAKAGKTEQEIRFEMGLSQMLDICWSILDDTRMLDRTDSGKALKLRQTLHSTLYGMVDRVAEYGV